MINTDESIDAITEGPLSSSQEGVWYQLQVDPANIAYFIVCLYRCREGLDPDLLEQAYNQVLRRHPALRTTFITVNGEARQVVHPFVPDRIERMDFRGHPAEERGRRVREYARLGAGLGGDLETGPLIRLQLLQVGEGHYFLLLSVHHIVCDGTSVALFKNELAHYYDALVNNEPTFLPEAQIDLAHFAAWEREWQRGKSAQAMLEYWKKQLSGSLAVIELPGMHQRRKVDSRYVRRYRFTISGEAYQDIKRACADGKQTTFRVMAAAYAVLLKRVTGQEDIIMGCPFSNRTFPELGQSLDRTIGMFVNMLPLRLNLGGDPTATELMLQVGQTVLDAQKNQALPFERLIAATNPTRVANRTPIFQVVINFQNITRRSTQDLLVYDHEFDHSKTVFDLSMDIKEIGQSLVCNLIYNGDLYDETMISQFAADYERILAATVSNPQARLSSIIQSVPGQDPGPQVHEKGKSSSGGKAALMSGSDQGKSTRTENMLGYSQESLWFLHQLDPEIPAYNSVLTIRLKGPLKVPALEKSVNEIIRRHSVLCAYFPEQGGEPTQLIRSFEEIALAAEVIVAQQFSEREQKIIELGRREQLIPFDMGNGPLYRFSLVEFDPQDHLLFLVTHHIISDGWSRQLMLDELSRSYNAFARGELPQLPELNSQYSDYVRWQRQQAQRGALDEHLDYWLANIDPGSSLLNLPYDHPHPAVQTYTAGRYITSLTAQSSQAFKSFCKQEHATIFMGILAALDVLLYRFTGQGTITVGCPFANRSGPEFDRLIGFFVNTMPVQVTLEADLTFRQVLRKVRERMLGAMTHQSLPFDKLVAAINPQRDLSRVPLFQVVLNFKNVPRYDLDQSQLQMEETVIDSGVSAFEIDFDIVDGPGGLQLV